LRRSTLRKATAAWILALSVCPSGICLSLAQASGRSPTSKPNFVVILIDDLGYADIGPFGSKLNDTPHLDRMAAEGLRLTSFYVAAPVCTPSRAALLTGCYPQRVGLGSGSWHIVLFPGDRHGLHPDEVTLAEVLQDAGYRTGCFGKWHLGDQPGFLPTDQGFDEYFGIPYSNDMWPALKNFRCPPLPLLRGREPVGEVADMEDQAQLCRLFTEEAVTFLREHQDEPFFLYLPHAFIHNPRAARDGFRRRAKNPDRTTGAQIEEVDWSVGRILDTLRELELDKHTIVVFASDNGGSGGTLNTPLRGGKGSTWEGGLRVPAIAWGPGNVPAGAVSDEVVTAMDLLPTFAKLAGARLPKERRIDGVDVSSLLRGVAHSRSPHEAFYFYRKTTLRGVRAGRWKLHASGALYDLDADVGETKDLAADHPDVVRRLSELLERARVDLGDGSRPGKNVRPVGKVDNARSILPRFPGVRSTWYGFERYDIHGDSSGKNPGKSSESGFRLTIVAPRKMQGPGNWIWRARFFGHEPQADLALLDHGLHLVYADVAELYGSPKAVERLDAVYRYLTEDHGLAQRPALEGMSRGGLTTYNWAIANPERVACIYADNPVCDFKSFPGVQRTAEGPTGGWKRVLESYGFTEAEALAYEGNPIDRLQGLAAAGVPILHVCGTADEAVPMSENTDILVERYRAFGGDITVIRKEGVGHHPHSLEDPAPIVDFVLKHTGHPRG